MLCCFNVNVVSIDDESPWHQTSDQPILTQPEGEAFSCTSKNEGASKHHVFNIQEEQYMILTALLLKMHYKLGHLPFSKINIMAANGNLD
jgi:hypothetical protein